MSSDIVLTSALRNNLLSLQNTQRLIDTTQLRLATGLKVNSALDNPSSFFTAQSLNNRASDLSRLLDNINLSIRTIEEADAGITALTALVEQAQSIGESARDQLAASEGVARAIGTVDLRDTGALVANTSITADDDLVLITTDDDGTQISETIQILTGDTAYTLAAKITDQFADSQNGEITAEITDEGFLSIQSSDGRSFRLTTNVVGTNDLSVADFTAIGLGDIVEVEDTGAGGAARVGATIVAGNTIRSVSLFETAAGDLAEAGDLLSGTLFDAEGNTVLAGVNTSIVVSINNTTNITFTSSASATIQDFINAINDSATGSEFLEASFDDATGQIVITSISDEVDNVQFRVTGTAGTTFDIGFGDPSGNLDPRTTTVANVVDQTFNFNQSTESLDDLASDFNIIREQIDQLVVDANFRGVNLLNGDDLVTFFNENNTNSLTTSGVTFTSDGLGVTQASFRNSTGIELSLSQISDAQTSVRSFGNTLANSIAVIQARRDFTESTINTLTSGADDLTVADQNEEGANLLALQTRQALGTTSLSLASQSQQSVLRLF